MGLYSYSKISTYKRCPYRYKLKYIDKIPELKTIEQFMGTRVHEALELLYKKIISAKVIPLDTLIEYFQKKWDSKWDDEIKIVRANMSVGDYRNLGRVCVEQYYSTHYPFDESKTLATEKKVTVPLGESGSTLVGFIDRIAVAEDGTYEIHDYKTNGSLPSQKDKDEDKQLALYELAIRNMWKDVKDVKLIWHYLVFNKEITSTRCVEEIEALKAEKIAVIEEIESAKDYKPHESALCDWCSYQETCPVWKHKFIVEQLPEKDKPTETGTNLVDTLASLQSQKKTIENKIDDTKTKLIEYSDTNNVDRVYGTDKTAKIKREEHLKFPDSKDPDRAKLEDLIKSKGYWDQVSLLNTRRLTSMLSDPSWDKSIARDLNEFSTVEIRSTVTLIKNRTKKDS